MKKPTFFIIDYVIYPFNILICIGAMHIEVVKYVHKKYKKLSQYDIDKLRMSGLGRTSVLEGGETVLQLESFKKNDPESIAILQHEIFHAVHFLFIGIGIELTKESHEAYAYLVEYLTKEILKELWKK